MKPRRFKLVLLLSLAVNLGVLGYLGWNAWRDWHWRRVVDANRMRSSGLDPARYRLVQKKLDEHFRRLDAVRRPFRQARRELAELAEQATPDSARLAAVLEQFRLNRRNWRKWLFEAAPWMDQLWRPDVMAKMDEKEIADLEAEIARRESLLVRMRGVR
jgi:uncharacterized membrane protein